MQTPNKKMESIVNCPVCGEQVPVILTNYKQPITDIMAAFEKSIGVGKTDHFDGECKCKCGLIVTVSLHATAGEFTKR